MGGGDTADHIGGQLRCQMSSLPDGPFFAPSSHEIHDMVQAKTLARGGATKIEVQAFKFCSEDAGGKCPDTYISLQYTNMFTYDISNS